VSKFDDFKHKVLDVVDAVKADPKKQLLAVGIVCFVVGVLVGKILL
jgi:hypothetical protein